MTEPTFNPYQSPAASSNDQRELDGNEGPARPAYTLYSVRSITLASFLGSPIAGGVVMAINFRRLGRSAAAFHAVFWTIVVTVAIIALPEETHIPTAAFVVPQIFAMYALAKSLLGPAVEKHQQLGGSLASAWGAAGIGVIVALFVLGAIVGIALLEPGEAESVDTANTALRQGASSLEKKDYDAAIRSFTEVIRVAPKFAGAYNNRGIAYRQKGEHSKAIADYSEAIRLDPENSEIYNNRGVAYRIIGDLDKAIADFTEAIRIDPDCSSAYAGRGLAYSQKGDKAKAQVDFEQAKKLGQESE